MIEPYNQAYTNTPFAPSNEQQTTRIPERPKSRLGISIAATVIGFSSVYMCCIGAILGAVAIVFATQSSTKYAREDYSGAQSSSQTALVLSIVSFFISLLAILVFLFFYSIGDAVSISDLGGELDAGVIDRLR